MKESLDDFKLFLETAPANWDYSENIKRFQLPNGDTVSCILWNELFHITGTDIVKALTFRFEALGRKVVAQKKFEEGIFSDLRNLKPMQDSTLEESRSDFLKFLYENQCIRTQKKQKVFYWFSVKHDKLFLDALERDLKREASGQPTCTEARESINTHQTLELAKAQCSPVVNAFAQHSNGVGEPQINFNNADDNMHTPKGLITPPTNHYSPMMKTDSSSYVPGMISNQMMNPSPALSHTASPSLMYQEQINDMTPQYSLPMNSFFESGLNDNSEPEKPKFYRNYEEVSKSYARPGPYNVQKFPASKSMQDGAKLHTCPFAQCGRQFKRQEHLRRHYRSHTGERPYSCKISGCNRSFARSDHLSQHLKTHEGNMQAMENQYMNEFEPSSLLSDHFHSFIEDDISNNSPYEGYPTNVINGQMDVLMNDLLSLDQDVFAS